MCELEALAVDETTLISVQVLAYRPGTLSATATVESECTRGPDPRNNMDTVTTTVRRPKKGKGKNR